MTIKQLKKLLDPYNQDAQIVFRFSEEVNGVHISSTARCKCTEKEIYLIIGIKGE